jgi:hypothetical protein
VTEVDACVEQVFELNINCHLKTPCRLRGLDPKQSQAALLPPATALLRDKDRM